MSSDVRQDHWPNQSHCTRSHMMPLRKLSAVFKLDSRCNIPLPTFGCDNIDQDVVFGSFPSQCVPETDECEGAWTPVRSHLTRGEDDNHTERTLACEYNSAVLSLPEQMPNGFYRLRISTQCLTEPTTGPTLNAPLRSTSTIPFQPCAFETLASLTRSKALITTASTCSKFEIAVDTSWSLSLTLYSV